MPFLPFVLLLAWQALSKSASFALGWATALYFGQVPGKQGRVLSVVSLVAAGWVIVLVGFAVPMLIGAALDWLGVIGRNFSVDPLVAAGLAAAIVVAPPASAGATVWAEFHDEKSFSQWLRLVASSYPATASLGLGVLQMVIFTPILIVQRLRRGQTMQQTALSMRDGTDDDDLVQAVVRSLETIGVEGCQVEDAEGYLALPMRTIGYAARHLVGAVVRGRPMRLNVDGLRIYAYATNVAVMGQQEKVFRARAALQRELPFQGAHVTWSDRARELEDALLAVQQEGGDASGEGGPQDRDGRLDALQQEMDSADLDLMEWGALTRIRMEIERRSAPARQRVKVKMAKPTTRMSTTPTTTTRATQLVRRSG